MPLSSLDFLSGLVDLLSGLAGFSRKKPNEKGFSAEDRWASENPFLRLAQMAVAMVSALIGLAVLVAGIYYAYHWLSK